MTAEPSIAESLNRSYLTALTLLGEESAAEALVAEAIGSLHPCAVTGRNIRNAVVARLVRLNLQR
jgi:hypothetical protein